jgi:hypothetical protein
MLHIGDRKRHQHFAGSLPMVAGLPLRRVAGVAAEIALASLLSLPAAAASQETVLHSFPGNRVDFPLAGLVMDGNGALYGTTSGASGRRCFEVVGCGTVFRLAPPGPGGSAWSETFLHRFRGGDDGTIPRSGLIIDANGALYGTTSLGGGAAACYDGCGTVFRLTPPAAGGSWTETVLYRFKGSPDGVRPEADLIMDANGALYGTTASGGRSSCYGGCGTVFRLTPPAGERRWTETVLYRFTGGADGAGPQGGLIMGPNGALYGITSSDRRGNCPDDCGTVFELTPPAVGEGSWTEAVLHRF